MFILFTLKTFGLFLGLDRTSRSPDLKVISTDGTTRDPRVRETDGANVVTSMTSKNLPRLEHKLEADGALEVVIVRRNDFRGFIRLFVPQERRKEVAINVLYSQYHQHFTISFYANFLLPKKYKHKL